MKWSVTHTNKDQKWKQMTNEQKKNENTHIV
jgi:hypothetical protein